MKGWYGNRHKHLLSSKGIKTSFELNTNWKGESYGGEKLADVIFPEENEHRVIDYSKTLHIYDNDEIRGRVVYMTLDNETVAYVYDMAIWDEYQNMGYGRQLYYKLENSLPKFTKQIYAHSKIDAVGFWKSVGFEKSKEQTSKGLVWMEKKINI